MLSIVTTAVGLVIGALTGFFFERRSTRAAEEQNRLLREELHDLRESVYSVGGSLHHPLIPAANVELHMEILKWAERVQDASGRVGRRQLIAEFVRRGRSREDVANALGVLEREGLARAEGAWLEVS